MNKILDFDTLDEVLRQLPNLSTEDLVEEVRDMKSSTLVSILSDIERRWKISTPLSATLRAAHIIFGSELDRRLAAGEPL